MNKLRKVILTLAFGGLAFAQLAQADTPADAIKIRIVNFKTCVEQSKLGKQEQATFESLKKQMESVLEEKEKTLGDIAKKFDDPDYLDSLSLEAETEIKRNFRQLSQEFSQQQNQYYQLLQQANFKIIQKLTEAVTAASKKVATDNQIQLVLSEEGAFYYSNDLDISSKVVTAMDESFEKEQQDNKAKPAAEAVK